MGALGTFRGCVDAQVVGCGSVYGAKADVFAPCALGGALSHDTVSRLQAKVVCGAANNQLATPDVDELLADRDILYAPDYLVNAGGIINVAGEYLGWSVDDVDKRVSAIAPRLQTLLGTAKRDGVTVARAADEMAASIIAASRQNERAA